MLTGMDVDIMLDKTTMLLYLLSGLCYSVGSALIVYTIVILIGMVP